MLIGTLLPTRILPSKMQKENTVGADSTVTSGNCVLTCSRTFSPCSSVPDVEGTFGTIRVLVADTRSTCPKVRLFLRQQRRNLRKEAWLICQFQSNRQPIIRVGTDVSHTYPYFLLRNEAYHKHIVREA